MEFMLLMVAPAGGRTAQAVGTQEMERFAAELAEHGQLRGMAPLADAEPGARVRVHAGKATVTDVPSVGTTERVAAAWVIAVDDQAAAIEIAKRCPWARAGVVEVRSLPDRDVARSGTGTKFMFLLFMPPDLSDEDGAGYREMVVYDGELKQEGHYLESSQLGVDPPGARVTLQAGQPLVTDGPFAEAKEIAGGYYVVEAASRGEAIELAKRCPHAKWGDIEVRQVL